MKRNVKLIGILLVLLMVASGCYYAHRHIKERMDKAQKWSHEKKMDRRGMNQRGQFMYRGAMNGRRGQNGMGPARGMNPMGRGQMQPGNMLMGRGRMQPGNMLNRIPDLTEKQRKEIAGLRQKEMTDMMKFREETQAKMQSMREENRKKIMDLLTDEQKKFLETAPVPGPPAQMPAPVKQ